MKKHFYLWALLLVSTCTYAIPTVTIYMNYQNVTRSFLVHVPPTYTPQQKLPCVFNLHGYGSDAPQQEFYSRMSETADTNNFIVVYPNGIANSWNAGFQFPYNSNPDDVGFISKLIDTMYTLYNIDLLRVYACGMSNGGFQSYRLACDLENRIAAIAGVTGTITELTALNCTQSRRVPVLHIHGTQDPLVNYNGATGYKSVDETINFVRGKNGCSTTNDVLNLPDTNVNDSSTVQRIRYTDCNDGTEVWLYKITGGGHTWPNAYIDYIYGPTNRDFDASQEIWNFFNRFTLNGPATGINETASAMQLQVYPNPSAGNYRLSVAGYAFNNPLQLLVYDINGKLVLQQPVTGGNTDVSLTGAHAGMYVLKLQGDGFSVSRRIVKE